VNLSVAAWIKFDQSVVAAVSTTVVLALSLVAMLFFHRKWTSHILDEEKVDLVGIGFRGTGHRYAGVQGMGSWYRAAGVQGYRVQGMGSGLDKSHKS
jgi:Flp pilus assembly protein protease CpaA